VEIYWNMMNAEAFAGAVSTTFHRGLVSLCASSSALVSLLASSSGKPAEFAPVASPSAGHISLPLRFFACRPLEPHAGPCAHKIYDLRQSPPLNDSIAATIPEFGMTDIIGVLMIERNGP
jgi:hypothetical protein